MFFSFLALLAHEDKRHFHGKEKPVFGNCILFCNHLASLAEGDLLLSFPYVGFGLLIASIAKDLLLGTKYKNILGLLNVISVPKQIWGF